MNKVLVTGGSGFLGRHIIQSLVRRGFEVHAMGRSETGRQDPIGVRWHRADLFDRRRTTEVLQQVRPAGLIHLAWATEHRSYWTTPENLDWTAASIDLMRAFRESGGGRVVLAGTSAEYDWSSGSALDERRSPLRPSSLYGHCKNALREVVEAWAPAAGLSWAWGRLFNIFGPGENAARLVPRVVRTLIERRELTLDDCSDVRDFLGVGEAGDAFGALYASDVSGAINIASGLPVSVRQLVQCIAGEMGREGSVTFGAPKAPGASSPAVVASVTRLREELGWVPSTTLAQSVHLACQWWLANLPAGERRTA